MAEQIIWREQSVPMNLSYQTVYTNQENLMHMLVGAGKLKAVNLELNTREHQLLFKTICAALNEEITEFFDSYMLVKDIITNTAPPNIDRMELANLLSDTEEEVGDIMAFTLELLVFCGIDNDELWKALLPEEIAPIDPSSDALAGLYQEVKLEDMVYDSFQTERMKYHINQTLNLLRPEREDIIIDDDIAISTNRFNIGDSFLIPGIEFEAGLFSVINHFNRARNNLKSRPWRRSNDGTDINEAISEVLTGLKQLLSVFSYLGWDYQFILEMVYKKNLININRVKNAY